MKTAIIATALGAGMLFGVSAEPKPLRVTGKVKCAEKVPWPSGAIARVAIVDLDKNGAPGAVLVESTVEALGKEAPEFELQLPRRVSRTVGITVRLTDAEGQLRWVTETPYLLAPSARSRGLEIVVSRAKGTDALSRVTRSIQFECEGSLFKAEIKGDLARVELPHQRVELPRLWSASGAEYRNGGTALRVEGNAVRFDVAGKHYRTCAVVAER